MRSTNKIPSQLNQVFATSERVDDDRTPYSVLAKGMEEMGELAQELLIANNEHYKNAGKDGVVGEAIDVIVCMFDIIYQFEPLITEEEVHRILARKLAKWEEKAALMAERNAGIP